MEETQDPFKEALSALGLQLEEIVNPADLEGCVIPVRPCALIYLGIRRTCLSLYPVLPKQNHKGHFPGTSGLEAVGFSCNPACRAYRLLTVPETQQPVGPMARKGSPSLFLWWE